MADEKRIIHAGRDYFENIARHATVITGASTHNDQTQRQINPQQYAQTITPESTSADILKLLTLIQQELVTLKLSEDERDEIVTEVKSAENLLKKAKPDKPKIADRLKSAVEALKGLSTLGTELATLGNSIGQAIVWCGEKWTEWS
ncbi:conserved hypothetical protein [Gammaproteobacteria bacterium]